MDDKKEYHECNQNDGFCTPLSSRVQMPGFRGKGFVVMQIATKEFKIKTIGVAYKESASDKGLMLNVCPWCGKTLQWWK